MNDQEVVLVFGKYTWTVGTRVLRLAEQESEKFGLDEIGLTPKIFRLLMCLYEGRSGVVSKEQIIDFVWESKPISQESVSQLINRTRCLLEDKDKRILVNEPGIGYSLVYVEQDKNKTSALTSELSRNVVSPTIEAVSKVQPALNVRYLGLILLTLITIVNLWLSGIAVYYNMGFLRVLRANPYPNIVMKDDGKVLVKIDGSECIYDKTQFLLQCQ
ncbi:winged helix-turn-helix domain-containing protein [Vibrio rotiferianus]|uniref:winged helix-turn-helix domain-containing protein n=1 Tax=Vibrio rotiferianus TaxID=190895 RepID=UPI00406A724E